MQGALSLLGPVMWGSFALDLALKAIGTDYGRVVRAVFILAQVNTLTPISMHAIKQMCLYLILFFSYQVRLVRTKGFVNPLGSTDGSGKKGYDRGSDLGPIRGPAA